MSEKVEHYTEKGMGGGGGVETAYRKEGNEIRCL
jgi:hypothetical protein